MGTMNTSLPDALKSFVDEQVSQRGCGTSSEYVRELNLPGLRAWPLKRHPCIVVYFEQPDCIDVWRVLHGQRDIPARMQDPDPV